LLKNHKTPSQTDYQNTRKTKQQIGGFLETQMMRLDIPNLIGKNVMLKNLKAVQMNYLEGSVISWNNKKERFLVKLENDQEKYIKPINLDPVQKPDISDIQYSSQFEFIKALNLAQNNTFIDEMLDLFQNLEEEKYWSTYLMINFVYGKMERRMKDTCLCPKLEKILRNIIETSKFDDLIVHAKFVLVMILEMAYGTQRSQEIVNLSLECLENHYGFLPAFFLCHEQKS